MRVFSVHLRQINNTIHLFDYTWHSKVQMYPFGKHGKSIDYKTSQRLIPCETNSIQYLLVLPNGTPFTFHGSFWIWAHPVREGVTWQRLLSLAIYIPKITFVFSRIVRCIQETLIQPQKTSPVINTSGHIACLQTHLLATLTYKAIFRDVEQHR